MENTHWAYLAGLIDGEGSISIVRWRVDGKLRTELRVTIYNNNLGMMAWLVEKFGGYQHEVRRRPRKGSNHAQSYAWETHPKRASELLRGALPYLVAKYGQAELALQYQSTKRRCGRIGTDPEVLAHREELRTTIKFLNRRGGDALEAERRHETHQEGVIAKTA